MGCVISTFWPRLGQRLVHLVQPRQVDGKGSVGGVLEGSDKGALEGLGWVGLEGAGDDVLDSMPGGVVWAR